MTINTIVALADTQHSVHMVNEGLLDSLQPLYSSPVLKIRLQALWIVCNISSTEDNTSAEPVLKRRVITFKVVAAIVKVHL